MAKTITRNVTLLTLAFASEEQVAAERQEKRQQRTVIHH